MFKCVTYVYPTPPETRTVPVRVELVNPGQLLKPAMFAQVDVPVERRTARHCSYLGGDRQWYPTDRPQCAWRRSLRAAGRSWVGGSESHIEVMDGVAGEKVSAVANFLIDVESNLKAAVGGFGYPGHGGAPNPK